MILAVYIFIIRNLKLLSSYEEQMVAEALELLFVLCTVYICDGVVAEDRGHNTKLKWKGEIV